MRRSAPRILLSVIAALCLLVGACADDGELGGPDFGGTLAAKVGSFEYTASELEDEVERWASNPEFMRQVLGVEDLGEPGRPSSAVVSFVLTHRVLSEQSRQLVADQGGEPTDEEVSSLLDQIDQAFVGPEGEPLFQGYGEEFRRRLGVDFAYQQGLQTVDASTAEVPEVEINPRYGSFENQDRGIGRVVPPDGPEPAPSAQ